MIEEHAKIIAIEYDTAILEIIRKQACGLCGKQQGCGISIWPNLLGSKRHQVHIENSLNAKAGETVVIGIADGALLSSSALIYGVPMLGLLTGAVIGKVLVGSGADAAHADAAVLCGVLLGLCLSLIGLKLWLSNRTRLAMFKAVMLRKADKNINISCV